MEMSDLFLINSMFLGVGLSMDAFSVSLVNGLSDPELHPLKAAKIALVFAFFQALMPMLGWIATHTMLHYFTSLQKIVPWVSLLILSVIGGKMIKDSRSECCREQRELSGWELLFQGIATSLVALSAGFAIGSYPFSQALVCALVIALVTYAICFGGVLIGRTAGCRISANAQVLGGSVLILIGLEILLEHLF